MSVSVKDTEAAFLGREAKKAQEQYEQLSSSVSQGIYQVRALTRSDITDLKKELQSSHPDDKIVHVMEAFCILRGLQPNLDNARGIFEQDLSWMIDYDKV